MSKRRALIPSSVLVAALATATPALAAYPGTNGPIYFVASTYNAKAKSTAYANRGDLFVFTPGSPGSERQLTDTKGTNEYAPAISPGGTLLAHESFTKAGKASNGVDILNVSTGVSEGFVSSDELLGLAWTPDAKGLTFGTAQNGVYSGTVGSGNALSRPLRTSRKRGAPNSPAYTPDGATLLYVNDRSTARGTPTSSEIWAAAPMARAPASSSAARVTSASRPSPTSPRMALGSCSSERPRRSPRCSSRTSTAPASVTSRRPHRLSTARPGRRRATRSSSRRSAPPRRGAPSSISSTRPPVPSPSP